MTRFAAIGTLYSLAKEVGGRKYVWAVIENEINNNKTTLEIVDSCPEKGQRIKVSASRLYNNVCPIGHILQMNGEIVIENGIEYIEVPDKKQDYQKKK